METPAPAPVQAAIPPPPVGPVSDPMKNPVPTPPPVRRPIPPTLIAAIIVIVLGTLAVVGARTIFTPKQVVVTPTPTPTPIPVTPTPARTLSAIASQSAFMALDASVASLSAGINSYNPDDPSLSPPIIDLPLGFTSN